MGHRYPDANVFGTVRFVWVPHAFCGVRLHNGSEYMDLCPLHCCQLNLEIKSNKNWTEIKIKFDLGGVEQLACVQPGWRLL